MRDFSSVGDKKKRPYFAGGRISMAAMKGIYYKDKEGKKIRGIFFGPILRVAVIQGALFEGFYCTCTPLLAATFAAFEAFAVAAAAAFFGSWLLAVGAYAVGISKAFVCFPDILLYGCLRFFLVTT